MQDMWVQSLAQEDPLEKEMATYSSILAWEIPWTEEHGGLQSIRLQRIRHHWATFSWDCPSTSGLTWERLVFFTLVNFFGLTKVLLVLKSNLPIINVMIIKSFLPQMSNLPVFCMTVTCPNIIGWIIRFYLLIGNFLTFMCHVHHSFLSTSFVISFSRGSFWPRDRTWVSCIASRFITIWATREASIC